MMSIERGLNTENMELEEEKKMASVDKKEYEEWKEAVIEDSYEELKEFIENSDESIEVTTRVMADLKEEKIKKEQEMKKIEQGIIERTEAIFKWKTSKEILLKILSEKRPH